MSGLSGATATSLVPGDPDRVAWLAREYARYAAGACEAARALRRIDTGSWVGPAGDAFRTAIGEVPDKLERGQGAFAHAATALAEYAAVLRDAQADAALAIRRSADADAASDTWRRQVADKTPSMSSHDPGQPERDAAAHLLADAQARVERAAGRAADVLEDARHGAPHEPGLLSKAVHAVGSFFRGAGEATWGLAQLAYHLSPTYALIDPVGYVKNEVKLGKGLIYGVEHPVALGKALIDYDTWRTDPARALGHLVPDLVLTIATAGTGEAGVAAGRAAEGAEVAEELATRGAGAAAREAGMSEDAAAALEERFGSPAEGALKFQSSGRYPGQDTWVDRILQPGETVTVGSPGVGRFAGASDAVEEVGTDARRYYEGMQVQPRIDPVDGVPRYRSELVTYDVLKPMPAAEAIAEANTRFGAGGLREFFLADDIDPLVAEGYIGNPSITQMTNLEAAFGPAGVPQSPEVLEQLNRAVSAGEKVLAVSGLAPSRSSGGCR
jgi:hypothetical protein